MKLQVDYDDMIEIKQDMKGIEVILVHLETSEYFKGAEEDLLALRIIRKNLECVGDKIDSMLEAA